MFVLQALDSGEYSAFGSAILTDSTSRLFSFEALFTVQSTSVRFAATGSYQLLGPGFKREFFVEVRPLDNTGVAFIYRDFFLPEVHGAGSWVKDSYLFGGECKQTGAAVTCHVEPGESQTLTGRTLVSFADKRRVAFHFALAPHEPRTAMANIVSIYSKRRAS